MAKRIPYTNIVMFFPKLEAECIIPCIESRILNTNIIVTQKDADKINAGLAQAAREVSALINNGVSL